jgi:hypothetical protein
LINELVGIHRTVPVIFSRYLIKDLAIATCARRR